MQSIQKGETGDVLPWNAFTALSADIGLLGIDATRLFFFIERLAREAEYTANHERDGRQSAEQVENLFASIGRLLPMCAKQADRDNQTVHNS